jgi:hypothetical protein
VEPLVAVGGDDERPAPVGLDGDGEGAHAV